MAEQLGLDEVFGHRAAVEHHEGALGALGGLMDRAGHDLFTGTGLAFDHHRHARGRDLLEDPKDFPHADRLAHDVAEGFAVRRQNLNALVQAVELDVRFADRDRAAGLEISLFNAHAVDECAVGRVQILQQIRIFILVDAAVVAGHRVVFHYQIVVVHGAQRDVRLIEDVLGALAILALQHQLAFAQVQCCRATRDIGDLGRRDVVGELFAHLASVGER